MHQARPPRSANGHHQNMGKIIEIIQLFYIIYMKCVDFKLKYLQLIIVWDQ